ncbi:hypothetical protein EDB89DRAFT_2205519 [Lactarius sanguifluus]|nr:hypothetical protein EDB89DRAFT_2205519 [Lactarius sanguifluus]
MSTLDSLPVVLSPKSLLPGTLSQSSRSCELESTPAVRSQYHPAASELVPFLFASSETPLNAPISPHSTSPQRPPGLKTVGSDSSLLEVTPPLALSVPQQLQELSLVYEASLVFAPRPSLIYSSDSLQCTPACFGFALVLVTTAILSSLLNVSKALSVRSRKFWSKIEDFGNNQNGNLKTSKSRNIPAHRLRLGQYMPRASHFVFDPGGPASSSSLKLLSAHEDVHKCKPKTCSGFTILDTSSPIPIPTDNLTVFDPGVVEVVLELAHEDSATLDEDAR